MKLTRRPKLCIEDLEPRDCPSYVLRLAGGTLFVTGSPSATGQPGTVFLQKANNQWQVTHGTAPLGTYNAANVYLRVTQHNNTPITFNLNGHTDGGNITVDLGKGDNSDKPANATALLGGTTAGTLAGNFTALNGSGADLVDIGFTNNGTPSSSSVTVGGNVNFYAHSNPTLTSGPPLFNPIVNLLDTGFSLAFGSPTPTVKIGGSVNTVAAGAYIATGTTVGQDVTVTSTTNSLREGTGSAAQIYGNIGRNLTINGSQQSSGDIIFVGGFVPMTIGGNLSISTPGNQTNLIEISNTGVPGSTTVDGNTFIRTGDGTNQLTTDAVFNGDLSLQLGNGVNTDTTLSAPASGATPLALFPSDAVVSGNFQLTAGNGNNSLTTTGKPFAGAVNGTTHITLGNGTDSFTVASANLGGPFIWHSGNGNDLLTLAPDATTGKASYNVNVQFGNNDDTFALGANVSVTGRADGGGRLTANVFNPDPTSTLVEPFTLSNFP